MISATNTLFLQRLCDPKDEEAWCEFDARFRRVIAAFAMRMGLGIEDAAEAAQETIVRFFTKYTARGYDRSRGRLRSWVFAIAKCSVIDLFRTNRHQRGESALDDACLVETDNHEFNQQWRRAMLAQALDELRASSNLGETTIQAFELYALAQRPVDGVARELGMTVAEVYVAKSRVIRQVKGILNRMDRFQEQ